MPDSARVPSVVLCWPQPGWGWAQSRGRRPTCPWGAGTHASLTPSGTASQTLHLGGEVRGSIGHAPTQQTAPPRPRSTQIWRCHPRLRIGGPMTCAGSCWEWGRAEPLTRAVAGAPTPRPLSSYNPCCGRQQTPRTRAGPSYWPFCCVSVLVSVIE